MRLRSKSENLSSVPGQDPSLLLTWLNVNQIRLDRFWIWSFFEETISLFEAARHSENPISLREKRAHLLDRFLNVWNSYVAAIRRRAMFQNKMKSPPWHRHASCKSQVTCDVIFDQTEALRLRQERQPELNCYCPPRASTVVVKSGGIINNHSCYYSNRPTPMKKKRIKTDTFSPHDGLRMRIIHARADTKFCKIFASKGSNSKN